MSHINKDCLNQDQSIIKIINFDNKSRVDDISFTENMSCLKRFGNILGNHQKTISCIQWIIVFIYLLLLLSPILSWGILGVNPLYNHIKSFSLALFWGIGWPLIILSMMLFGRVWCGIFCPDGTFTEYISHHGKKKSIPRWIRWKGWPCTVFVGTILYGQLIGIYDNYSATLILLGIPSCLAILIGFLYGNGKRVWCMYLCPGNGFFGMLAKISPFYFHVDKKKWKQYFTSPIKRINCAPLINIHQMQSTSACHACGRCSGYRNAVELASRSPSYEILTTKKPALPNSEVFLLIWGMIGICTMALAWKGSAWYYLFMDLTLSLYTPDRLNLPWWLASNSSSPFLILFILLSGSVVSLLTYVSLRLACWISNNKALSWQQLSLCLIPVTGFGILIGLIQVSVSIWYTHGLWISWAKWLQIIFLMISSIHSILLGIRMIIPQFSFNNLIAFILYCAPICLLNIIWLFYFYL